ncbi:hypothetical protein SAMN04487970_102472 [Paenibacillus tianmuensis]|uniref:Uncharacterized protein n=1 Tax=Paenibacillus tianmuensis TaxID=624147 RepID=A0A1G4S8G7_9BACL|nr:hypothetical protein [Paenibacillus tianmuensis]SCW65328.1 hypothetical protein SAMN04487970_102472 [Paenibacillus tianmuensis]
MLAAAGILAFGAVIVWMEVPDLLKNKRKKDFWVFSVLLTLGLGLAIAKSMRAEVPNPLEWIAYLYKPLSDFIFGLLESSD